MKCFRSYLIAAGFLLMAMASPGQALRGGKEDSAGKKVFTGRKVSTGQEVPLTDFSPADTPAVWSPEWYKLNRSPDGFMVKMVDGSLHVVRGHDWHEVSELVLPQGSFLGVNQGEFGGGLFYKAADSLHPSTDTRRPPFFVNGRPGPSQPSFFGGLMVPPNNPVNQRIKGYSLVVNGNVMGIFHYKDSIFFTEGLAHMGLLIGGLYSLCVHQDSFTIARVADLKDCPMACLADGPRLWVVTSSGFLVVENGQVQWLFTHLFWEGLSATSICRDRDGMLYVGIRGGYAKIDPVMKKLIFYKWRGLKPGG